MKALVMLFQLKSLSPLLLVSFTALLLGGIAGPIEQAVGQTVVFQTNLGDIEVELRPDAAPIAVANFLSYVNSPAGSNYENTFFHRAVVGLDLSIVQGGGFFVPVNNVAAAVPTQPPIVNEFGISNTRGTIAFAKMALNPDSATNQWFFNTADNSANLDFQNGGFTVFGSVISGMDVVDKIQGLDTFNLDAADPGVFDDVPLIDATDLVVLNDVILLGDINMDGNVDFFDINPFISILSANTFEAEADFDLNGTVDFFDITPFINTLSQLSQ